MKWIGILGAALTLVSTLGQAQETDQWDWKITPYLWGINMTGDTSIGPISQDIDVSFSDILSDMEIGGAVESKHITPLVQTGILIFMARLARVVLTCPGRYRPCSLAVTAMIIDCSLASACGVLIIPRVKALSVLSLI